MPSSASCWGCRRVLATDLVEYLWLPIVTAVLGGVAVVGCIGLFRYWNGSHVLKARSDQDREHKVDGMLRWFWGTPADEVTGTPEIPGARITFPKMRDDIGEIKDMVSDLVIAQHGAKQ